MDERANCWGGCGQGAPIASNQAPGLSGPDRCTFQALCAAAAPARRSARPPHPPLQEFKDRSGKDVGRSVSAWGFWGDALNGPYHPFGTLAEDPAFYK